MHIKSNEHKKRKKRKLGEEDINIKISWRNSLTFFKLIYYIRINDNTLILPKLLLIYFITGYCEIDIG